MTKRRCSRCEKPRDVARFVGARGKICDLCRKRTSRAGARASHLAKTYEITPEEYAELAKDGCAACGGTRDYNLPVDHDHALAQRYGIRASIRGALCKRCNKVLRDVHDDPEVLRSLIAYLLNPPAKKVLFP